MPPSAWCVRWPVHGKYSGTRVFLMVGTYFQKSIKQPEQMSGMAYDGCGANKQCIGGVAIIYGEK